MASLEEIAAAETRDLSVRQKVEAFYKGTDALTKFSTEAIVPIIRGQLDLNDREKAIVGIYLRMHAWMHSLVTLNSRLHFRPRANGILLGERFTGCGVDCLKRLRSGRGNPLAVDEDVLKRHVVIRSLW